MGAVRLLIDTDAAQYIGMSESFLRNGRKNGTLKSGTPTPRYVKIGRAVRYDIADLDEWINQFAKFEKRAEESLLDS